MTSPPSANKDGVTTESLTLAGAEGMLEAALSKPSQPRFRAVVAHPHPLYGGTMENLVVREAETALLAAGGEVLRFNFRGVGASQGRHDGRAEHQDVRVALEYLATRDPGLPNVLVGYSFGAAMATMLVKEVQISEVTESKLFEAGVLLIAPPLTHYDFSPLDSVELPIGLVYGEADELTPAGRIDELLAGRRSLPTLGKRVPAAGHDLGTFSDPTSLRDALRQVVEWTTSQGLASDPE